MRVFVAGANGAVGKRLVPMLVSRGHQVTGTATSETSKEAIRAMGAEAVVVDGLDAAGIGEAVARANPDAIIHEMTALSGTQPRPAHIYDPFEVSDLSGRTLTCTLKPAGIHRNWSEPTVTTVLSRSPPDVCRDSGMRYQVSSSSILSTNRGSARPMYPHLYPQTSAKPAVEPTKRGLHGRHECE